VAEEKVVEIDPRITMQVAKLELAEGDILVIRSTIDRDPTAMLQGSKIFSEIVPKGVKVIAIPKDVELTKITKAQIATLALEGKA
jgi:hypothetical protein